MATERNSREKGEALAAAQGTQIKDFAAAGKTNLPPTELANVEVGEEFTIPNDYKIYEREFNGNKYQFVVTEEGKFFYVSWLTRGAKPKDGEDFVRPKGTVIEKFYKNPNASYDEAFKGITGKPMIVKEFTKVEGENFTTKVATIDFVKQFNIGQG